MFPAQVNLGSVSARSFKSSLGTGGKETMRETPQKSENQRQKKKKNQNEFYCVGKLFQSINKGILALVNSQPRLASSQM